MSNIWIVNAFSTESLKGNPAGVVLFDSWPDDEYLLEIAYKLGFSNSAFIVPKENGDFHIRWFTTNSEAPLCGHATIAATKVLLDENKIKSGDTVKFISQSGDISCTENNGWFTLNFPRYEMHESDQFFLYSDIFNTNHYSFFAMDERFLFLALESAQELDNFTPNINLLQKLPQRGLIVTASSHLQGFDFNSRYFAPKVGIIEDPVCASAHCRLIPYWASKLGKSELKAFQASKRTGILKCKNLHDRVLISGEAVTVFKGELNNVIFEGKKYAT